MDQSDRLKQESDIDNEDVNDETHSTTSSMSILMMEELEDQVNVDGDLQNSTSSLPNYRSCVEIKDSPKDEEKEKDRLDENESSVDSFSEMTQSQFAQVCSKSHCHLDKKGTALQNILKNDYIRNMITLFSFKI